MPQQTGIATCWRDWINDGMKWEASNGSPVIPLCRLVFIRFACRAQRVAECGPNQVRKFVLRSYPPGGTPYGSGLALVPYFFWSGSPFTTTAYIRLQEQ